MALGFSSITDHVGPAVYLLGNRMLENDLKRKGEEIDAATSDQTQVVYLDVDSGDGAKVADFYDIERTRLPLIMIIQDDDTIYMSWEGAASLPPAEHVAYEIRQITGHGKV